MVLLRSVALALCGFVFLHGSARAAILIHDYTFRESLEDRLGGNALQGLGGEITALGYVFAANQGFAFSSRLFNPRDYTVELSFRLDEPKYATKVVDFHSRPADPGLSVHNAKLAFSPAAMATLPDFMAGSDAHVVLTRDGATDVVTGYVNGEVRFSFRDDLSLAAPPGLSNRLGFFLDGGFDGSGGTANFLHIYDSPLGANEVGALFAALPPSAVPEPSPFILLTIGGLAWALRARLKPRKR